jgi:hypothetical protein
MDVTLPFAGTDHRQAHLDAALRDVGGVSAIMLSVYVISFVIFIASVVRSLSQNSHSLRSRHQKKSGGIKSGNSSGHRSSEIARSSKKLWIIAMDSLDVWHVAPSCWK